MAGLASPNWRSSSPPPPLSDYFCLADGRVAALIDRRGRCDFLCWPHFDSPLALGRLLDPEGGGSVGVGVGADAPAGACWLPRSRVLRIEWTKGVVVDCALVDAGSSSSLVWLVSGPPGALVTVELQHPTAGGGPHWEPLASGARLGARSRADGPGGPLWLNSDASLRLGPSGFTAELPASGMVLRLCGHPDPERATALTSDAMRRRLARAAAADRAWLDGIRSGRLAPVLTATPRWAIAMLERSLLTLRGLQDRRSGLVVASPVTSIPQSPGSTRAWDYRYAWLRDCSAAGMAFCRAGANPEAEKVARGLAELLGEAPLAAPPVRCLDGSPLPAEHFVSHLAGYGGSPVRIGNGAAGQVQLDALGEVVRLAGRLADACPSQLLRRLPALAAAIAARSELPDHGIWEIRGMPRPYVHSKLVCGAALLQAAQLAHRGLIPGPAQAWEEGAEAIREAIARRGRGADGSLRMAFDDQGVDAAVLAVYALGFPEPLPAPNTLDAVLAELGEWPLVARHRPQRDGLADPCAPFVFAGLWAAVAEFRVGRGGAARRRLRAICDLAGPALQLSEVADPKAALMLGNYPQVQSHAALVEAVSEIWEEALPANPAGAGGVPILDPR